MTTNGIGTTGRREIQARPVDDRGQLQKSRAAPQSGKSPPPEDHVTGRRVSPAPRLDQPAPKVAELNPPTGAAVSSTQGVREILMRPGEPLRRNARDDLRRAVAMQLMLQEGVESVSRSDIEAAVRDALGIDDGAVVGLEGARPGSIVRLRPGQSWEEIIDGLFDSILQGVSDPVIRARVRAELLRAVLDVNVSSIAMSRAVALANARRDELWEQAGGDEEVFEKLFHKEVERAFEETYAEVHEAALRDPSILRELAVPDEEFCVQYAQAFETDDPTFATFQSPAEIQAALPRVVAFFGGVNEVLRRRGALRDLRAQLTREHRLPNDLLATDVVANAEAIRRGDDATIRALGLRITRRGDVIEITREGTDTTIRMRLRRGRSPALSKITVDPRFAATAAFLMAQLALHPDRLASAAGHVEGLVNEPPREASEVSSRVDRLAERPASTAGGDGVRQRRFDDEDRAAHEERVAAYIEAQREEARLTEQRLTERLHEARRAQNQTDALNAGRDGPETPRRRAPRRPID